MKNTRQSLCQYAISNRSVKARSHATNLTLGHEKKIMKVLDPSSRLMRLI
jgi:hypothetical protein